MRKSIFTFCAIVLSATMAQSQNITNCATEAYNQSLRDIDPVLFDQAKQAFEASWIEYRKANPPQKAKNKTNPEYIIPVVFHVFHNNGSENLSDAQINGIMTQLNLYYRGGSSITGGVRPIFKDLIADCNFVFKLAKKDPNGNCTNGIVRIQTPLTNKATQTIKALSTWDTKKYLNIWSAAAVFSNGRAVGGFAQFPTSGSAKTDGLLIDAQQSLSGNTVAHEIGHILGLIHPFEGSLNDSCGDGDNVEDTPPTYFLYSEGGSNTGRPNSCANPNFNTCTNDNPDLPDMQENIMDYFTGSCTGTMFTLGQYTRMKFTLDNYRNQLWTPENLVATGINDGFTCTPAPIASFGMAVNTQQVCNGTPVNFIDNTYNASVNTWAWNFGEGANPATSTIKNPTNITWTTGGWKTVQLTSTGATGTSTSTKTNYVYVENPTEYQTITTGIKYVDWDYQNTFIQEGWTFENDEPANWVLTSSAKTNGNNSLLLSTLEVDPSNSYSLVSPTFNLTGAANPYISFNYSFAANYTSRTTTNDSRDGLAIQVSNDCGKTWITRTSVFGNPNSETTPNPLTTAGSPVQSSMFYVPVNASQWKRMSSQGSQLGSGAALGSVKFKIKFSYENGNNLYIDNLVIGLSGTVGGAELTAEDIQFKVSPNPFSATTTISYALNNRQQVQIELYDMVGRLVKVLANETQTQGTHQLEINREELGLKSGMYFVKTNIDGSGFSSKVVIQ